MNTVYLIRIVLHVVELLSCIIGFINWSKLKYTYWKVLPVYLAIITLIEFTGLYLVYELRLERYNLYLYQYFAIPLQFLFFCWLFYKYFFILWQRVIVIVGVGIFIIFWLIEIVGTEKSPHWFISLSYDAGVIVLLVLTLIFLIQLSSGNEILNFKTNIMFWVAMGLFAGYICTIPYYIWRNYLITYEKSKPELLYVPFYGFMFLNYLMYSLFCVGFIKWKQTN